MICPFSEAGCDWEGCWHEYQQHIDNCDIIINLPSTRRSDVRPFYYTLSFSPTSSLNGQQQSIECDKCHVSVPLSELNEHRETCLLQSEGQLCPLNTLGCPNESYMDSYELKQHLRVSEVNHLSMIVNRIQLLKRKVTLGPVTQLPHHEVDENMNTEELIQDVLPISQLIENEVKNFVSGEKIKLQNELKSSMEEKLQAKDKEIASLKFSVVKLEKQIQSKKAEIEDRDFRLALIENSNYDGTMIWKIPQFSQRKADAENGKCTSIFSLPFYSGRYGYKMCLRLYIMGDGIGKGTHLSLFFVVMCGEFDNILQWPFAHKVTFKLINQAGGRDIVDTFQPDPMSASFRKPKSDMNIASGCPMFVTHTGLEGGGFVVDDTIFIKCTIDTSTIRHP